MKRRKFVLGMLVFILLLTIASTAYAYDSYNYYMEYVSTSAYYTLATDSYQNPVTARNVVTTYEGYYNAAWKVRCTCCNGDITQVYWHKTGDYTYPYEDYEHDLTGEKLMSRPNSNDAGYLLHVVGYFYGE